MLKTELLDIFQGKNEFTDKNDDNEETVVKLDREVKKEHRKRNFKTLIEIYSLFDMIFLRSHKFRCLVINELNITLKPLFGTESSKLILEVINERQLTKLREHVTNFL